MLFYLGLGAPVNGAGSWVVAQFKLSHYRKLKCQRISRKKILTLPF